MVDKCQPGHLRVKRAKLQSCRTSTETGAWLSRCNNTHFSLVCVRIDPVRCQQPPITPIIPRVAPHARVLLIGK